jgi:hypothetical protein
VAPPWRQWQAPLPPPPVWKVQSYSPDQTRRSPPPPIHSPLLTSWWEMTWGGGYCSRRNAAERILYTREITEGGKFPMGRWSTNKNLREFPHAKSHKWSECFLVPVMCDEMCAFLCASFLTMPFVCIWSRLKLPFRHVRAVILYGKVNKQSKWDVYRLKRS